MIQSLVDDISRDIRYALRVFLSHPAFTCVAVLTLALGVGANTAIFSVVHAVLLQPLAYKDADRLVRIVEHIPATQSATGQPARVASMAIDEFVAWRAQKVGFVDELRQKDVHLLHGIAITLPDGKKLAIGETP